MSHLTRDPRSGIGSKANAASRRRDEGCRLTIVVKAAA